jgi:hypothetical protein
VAVLTSLFVVFPIRICWGYWFEKNWFFPAYNKEELAAYQYVEQLAYLITEKVKFLGEGKDPVSPVQVMAIQIEVRSNLDMTWVELQESLVMMVFAIMQWCALCHYHPGSGCSNHFSIIVVRRGDCGMLDKTPLKTYYRTNGNKSGCLWISCNVSNKHWHMHSYIIKSHHLKYIFGCKYLHSGCVANCAICYGSWVSDHLHLSMCM